MSGAVLVAALPCHPCRPGHRLSRGLTPRAKTFPNCRRHAAVGHLAEVGRHVPDPSGAEGRRGLRNAPGPFGPDRLRSSVRNAIARGPPRSCSGSVEDVQSAQAVPFFGVKVERVGGHSSAQRWMRWRRGRCAARTWPASSTTGAATSWCCTPRTAGSPLPLAPSRPCSDGSRRRSWADSPPSSFTPMTGPRSSARGKQRCALELRWSATIACAAQTAPTCGPSVSSSRFRIPETPTKPCCARSAATSPTARPSRLKRRPRRRNENG